MKQVSQLNLPKTIFICLNFLPILAILMPFLLPGISQPSMSIRWAGLFNDQAVFRNGADASHLKNSYLYLPVVYKNYGCYPSKTETEPNNYPEQANGPLCYDTQLSGKLSFVEDDYFKLFLDTGESLNATLSPTDTNGMQLLLYDTALNLITYDPTQPFEVQHTAITYGWYYLRVATIAETNQSNYTLSVDFTP